VRDESPICTREKWDRRLLSHVYVCLSVPRWNLARMLSKQDIEYFPNSSSSKLRAHGHQDIYPSKGLFKLLVPGDINEPDTKAKFKSFAKGLAYTEGRDDEFQKILSIHTIVRHNKSTVSWAKIPSKIAPSWKRHVCVPPFYTNEAKTSPVVPPLALTITLRLGLTFASLCPLVCLDGYCSLVQLLMLLAKNPGCVNL